MSDWPAFLLGIGLLAMAAYAGYLFGKAVGRMESAEDRRLASETWRLCSEVNRATGEIINEAKTSLAQTGEATDG